MEDPQLRNSVVSLQPADSRNVDLLITWTLDPIAQGEYKRIPNLSRAELRQLFLSDPERQYFLIRRSDDAAPLGRFYWRAWRFNRPGDAIDWELNIILAKPEERGKGYGTLVRRLAAEHLASLPATQSVFAFTLANNQAEQRALLKAGFRKEGSMPNARYPVPLPSQPCVLFVWPTVEGAANNGLQPTAADGTMSRRG